MLRRIVNVVLVLLVVAGAVGTYAMKHRAEMASERVAKLEAEIAREKDAVALLKAEWSVLTQPGRLQDVVATYKDSFHLEPFSPQQVARIEDIPMRSAGTSSTATPRAADPFAALINGSGRP